MFPVRHGDGSRCVLDDRAAVLSWDWREQPDLDRLAEILTDVSGGTVHLTQVDTDSDQYAITLSTAPLDDTEALAVYEKSISDKEVRP